MDTGSVQRCYEHAATLVEHASRVDPDPARVAGALDLLVLLNRLAASAALDAATTTAEVIPLRGAGAPRRGRGAGRGLGGHLEYNPPPAA